MSESLGLTSHKSSCNCTACGMLRAGVCINCAEKIAALIFESGPRELAVEPYSGCLPRGDRAVLLRAARALARAAYHVGRDNSWRMQCTLPCHALVAAGARSKRL